MNNYLVAINWDLLTKSNGSDSGTVGGILKPLQDALSVPDLIGILAGVIGVTVVFTLVWRFTAYIKNSIIGGMTNSRRKGK